MFSKQLVFYKKLANPGLFVVYFRSFQTQYYRKTVGFSGIRTQIVGVEGEHTDHLTTTTAQKQLVTHGQSCKAFMVRNDENVDFLHYTPTALVYIFAI